MAIENISKVSKLIGDKWTLQIISSINGGNTKYCKIEHELSINPRTLANRLSRLVDLGIIIKTIDENDPRNISYNLSETGKSLLPIITSLAAWQEKNLNCETITSKL